MVFKVGDKVRRITAIHQSLGIGQTAVITHISPGGSLQLAGFGTQWFSAHFFELVKTESEKTSDIPCIRFHPPKPASVEILAGKLVSNIYVDPISSKTIRVHTAGGATIGTYVSNDLRHVAEAFRKLADAMDIREEMEKGNK